MPVGWSGEPGSTVEVISVEETVKLRLLKNTSDKSQVGFKIKSFLSLGRSIVVSLMLNIG
ncbi:hypothetical protein D3C80_1754820 [compost metagenome]